MAGYDRVMTTTDRIITLAQSATVVCTGADLADANELLNWAQELKQRLTPSYQAFRDSCANYR
jgi:hypothetical protein